MKWNSQQAAALTAVAKWLADPNGQQVFRLFGWAGTGKAQPLTAMIQTPHGPVRMGDIEVGHEVLGSNGKATLVTGVFPQGVKPVYRVTFRDGAVTECCGEHLWAVESIRKKTSVMTTAAILAAGVRWTGGDRRWKIPLCESVEFDSPPAPLDAYTVGALLGDGYIKGTVVKLVCPDQEVVDRITLALPDGLAIRSDYVCVCPTHTIKSTSAGNWNPLLRHIQDHGIAVGSLEKRIPRAFLYAPVADRMELLRGLMDTNGSVNIGNRTSFSTSSPGMAEDMRTLVQSLGGTVISRVFERKDCANREFHLNVKVNFCPFHLSRKANLWRPSSKNPPSRYIDSIELVGEAEQQCIAVAAEDHLYLTDEFIVTHNTTLARHLAENVKGSVYFAAYTGKAAHVLTTKGCPARTIHSLIYRPKARGKGTMREIENQLVALTNELARAAGVSVDHPSIQNNNRIVTLRGMLQKEAKASDRPLFDLNPDSDVKDAALLVLDEVSMVGKMMGADVDSFKRKTLVLGDPFQLAPVGDGEYYTGQQPDIMLTDVERAAADNPIIRLTCDLRNKIMPRAGAYGGTRVLHRSQVVPQDAMSVDQVLVGRNATRMATNRRMRALRGNTDPMPVVGDKLVCLRNNSEYGLLNGQLWNVEDVGVALDDRIALSLIGEEGQSVPVVAHTHYFEGRGQDLAWYEKKEAEEFDYGDALTVHKSQGSQWDNVMLFDESSAFRDMRWRWLYTGATRTAVNLTLVQGM